MSGNGYGFLDSVEAPLTLITAFLRLARSRPFSPDEVSQFRVRYINSNAKNKFRPVSR